ncbi:WD40-repeat-containing domain protein [Limtongia smithiae]|uniref:WD40-repeat-containing domain protein n=1 Tax=Limtongia smithiae TaxID=1125753 RepID=UPI0034CD664C
MQAPGFEAAPSRSQDAMTATAHRFAVPVAAHPPANAMPEPPTPAPSPTPYTSFFPHDAVAIDTAAEDSTPLAALARQFAGLHKNEQKALLASLLSVCDTATLSFVVDYVSPLLKKDPFAVLPNEICFRILSHIDEPRTLARAAQVSRRWAELVSDDMIWKGLCARLNVSVSALPQPNVDSESPPLQYQQQQLLELQQMQHRTSSLFSYPFNQPSSSQADAFRPQQQFNPVLSGLVSSPPTSSTALTMLTNAGMPATTTEVVTTTSSHNGDLSMMESSYLSQFGRQTQPRTYRSVIKQRFMVDSAWLTGGRLSARHVTTDQGVVTCLNLTRDYIIVALDNSRIHVFTSDGRLLHTLIGHVMGVWAIMPWGDTLVSGGCDRDVRVWDMRTGQCRAVMHGHTSTVRCLKMSNSRTAISGSRDASLRVWDIETGECHHVLLGHQASVRCLEVHGDLCVSGSYDTTAKVWSISRGVLLHTLSGHFSQIYALAFDGERVATGSLDTTVRIWSATSGQCLAVLSGHTSLVSQLQMSGDTLVTGSSDGSTRVWDLKRVACVHRLAAHDNSVTTLQFDDRRIVTGGSDGRVKVWDIKTGHHIRDLVTTFEAVWRIAFEDDKVVVLASRQNRTHMEVISFAPPLEELC